MRIDLQRLLCWKQQAVHARVSVTESSQRLAYAQAFLLVLVNTSYHLMPLAVHISIYINQ